MNYRTCTKFQLNKLVAVELGMNVNKHDLPPTALDCDYNNKYPDTVWAQDKDKPWCQYCYTGNCEDWSCLVVDFGINIIFDGCQVIANGCGSSSQGVSLPRADIGSAICIAFLEMRERLIGD